MGLYVPTCAIPGRPRPCPRPRATFRNGKPSVHQVRSVSTSGGSAAAGRRDMTRAWAVTQSLEGMMGWVEDRQERDEEFARLLAEEALVTAVLEELLEAMDRRGVTQAELARRAGVSRAAISKMLHGDLRTQRDAAHGALRRLLALTGDGDDDEQDAAWAAAEACVGGPTVDDLLERT